VKLLFLAVFLLASCKASSVPPQIDPIQVALPTGRIVVYGDSRPAVTGESFFMGRSDPAAERALIIKRIAAEKPDLIIHSGDLVQRGSSDDHWEAFDETHRAIFDAKIPFHTALGNHEYEGDTKEALGYYHRRFPDKKRCRWYAVQAGPLLFAMLDSNFDALAPEFVPAQDEWYLKTLKEAEADPAVHAVIVVSHHPPYTNSAVHGPSEETRRRFVDPASKFRKFKMYVAGHVHNYERFQIGGVAFLVSGGGGAPSTPVSIRNVRTPPAYDGPEIRPFHYLLFTVAKDRAAGETWMLQDDGSWKVGDRFDITW
jgi:predicted phosphodiesterase